MIRCLECRDITINKLYQYIDDTYKETITLKEMSDIFKNKLKNLRWCAAILRPVLTN